MTNTNLQYNEALLHLSEVLNIKLQMAKSLAAGPLKGTRPLNRCFESNL